MRLYALLLTLLSLAPFAPGDTIYAAKSNGDILAINPASGTWSVLVGTGTCWYDIALAPDGTLYGSDAFNLFEIDQSTGVATLVGAFSTFINGMTFVGDVLYGSGTTDLYTIDLADGHAQFVGSTGYPSAGDLQWFQGRLYLTASATPSDLLVRVDPATGHATTVGEIGFEAVYGLAASGSYMYGVTDSGELLEIDPVTGTGTLVGTVGGRVYGAASRAPAQEIPEPGALVLLGSGMMLAARRLRRSQVER